MQISEKTISILAKIITGDDDISFYRSGPQLVNFFNEIGFEERDEMEVAEEWVRNNILKVRRWLSLVKTPEGNNAYQTLLENLNMN